MILDEHYILWYNTAIWLDVVVLSRNRPLIKCKTAEGSQRFYIYSPNGHHPMPLVRLLNSTARAPNAIPVKNATIKREITSAVKVIFIVLVSLNSILAT